MITMPPILAQVAGGRSRYRHRRAPVTAPSARYRGGVTEDPWRDKLTADEYRVLRQAGTEAPFTGESPDTETEGVYWCRACGARLFTSDTKYHSGCGWPSFADAEKAAVTLHEDESLGMTRTEVRCANCDSHLGHLFTGEGIAPSDLPDQRYCINSISMTLQPKE